ncbi:unnamed protein product [Amoebophrya sp. A120]|nr:unnamed protein product [Amoebophrya sp. A120]|eukprot:GSA120T00000470001.1
MLALNSDSVADVFKMRLGGGAGKGTSREILESNQLPPLLRSTRTKVHSYYVFRLNAAQAPELLLNRSGEACLEWRTKVEEAGEMNNSAELLDDEDVDLFPSDEDVLGNKIGTNKPSKNKNPASTSSSSKPTSRNNTTMNTNTHDLQQLAKEQRPALFLHTQFPHEGEYLENLSEKLQAEIAEGEQLSGETKIHEKAEKIVKKLEEKSRKAGEVVKNELQFTAAVRNNSSATGSTSSTSGQGEAAAKRNCSGNNKNLEANSYVLLLPAVPDGSSERANLLCPTQIQGVVDFAQKGLCPSHNWGAVAGGEMRENLRVFGDSGAVLNAKTKPAALEYYDRLFDDENTDSAAGAAAGGEGNSSSSGAVLNKKKSFKTTPCSSTTGAAPSFFPDQIAAHKAERKKFENRKIPIYVLPAGMSRENVLPLAQMQCPLEVNTADFAHNTRFQRMLQGTQDLKLVGKWVDNDAEDGSSPFEDSPNGRKKIVYTSAVNKNTLPVSKAENLKSFSDKVQNLREMRKLPKRPTNNVSDCDSKLTESHASRLFVGALVELPTSKLDWGIFDSETEDRYMNDLEARNKKGAAAESSAQVDGGAGPSAKKRKKDKDQQKTLNTSTAVEVPAPEVDRCGTKIEMTTALFLFPTEAHNVRATIKDHKGKDYEENMLEYATNLKDLTAEDRLDRMNEFHGMFAAAKRLRKLKNAKGKEVSDARMEGDIEEMTKHLEKVAKREEQQLGTKVEDKNPFVHNVKKYLPEWDNSCEKRHDVFKKGLEKVFPLKLLRARIKLEKKNTLVRCLTQRLDDSKLRDACGSHAAYEMISARRHHEKYQVKTEEDAANVACMGALIRILVAMYTDKQFSFAGSKRECKMKFKIFDEAYTSSTAYARKQKLLKEKRLNEELQEKLEGELNGKTKMLKLNDDNNIVSDEEDNSEAGMNSSDEGDSAGKMKEKKAALAKQKALKLQKKIDDLIDAHRFHIDDALKSHLIDTFYDKISLDTFVDEFEESQNVEQCALNKQKLVLFLSLFCMQHNPAAGFQYMSLENDLEIQDKHRLRKTFEHLGFDLMPFPQTTVKIPVPFNPPEGPAEVNLPNGQGGVGKKGGKRNRVPNSKGGGGGGGKGKKKGWGKGKGK